MDSDQNKARRPWENGSSTSQTLPSISTLTSKLPPPGERPHPDLSINPPQRDSGAWMSNNSAITGSSNGTMPFLNSAHSPNGPGLSPYTPETTPGSTFGPSAAQTRQQNGTLADHPHRGSGDYNESRRSSVSGSIHTGMGNLVLGPTSPYNSNNQSQTSIVSGLQQQRGIPTSNGYSGSRFSTMNGPLSPYAAHRNSRSSYPAGRTAPIILENPGAEVYSADAPTRGQAYAFPDPDGPRTGASSRPGSTLSRRGSYAESYTSSIVTMESSRYPPGQHELPESHHHSLVNRPIDSLRQDPDSPGNGTTPYSRTPELRVTHKLAERKRRSEMKDCFESLRQKLPTGQTNKSSKWEILSRAIEYIESLETQVTGQRKEIDKSRHQMQEMDRKMQQMSEQLQRYQHGGSYQPPPSSIPTNSYGSAYQNGNDGNHDSGRTLPPLQNGAMQGVQYSERR